MSASHLVVVPAANEPESATQRIKRLQSEARNLAHQQVEMLAAALTEVAHLAGEIAEGGELYPVGAREIARRLVEDASKQSLTLSAIIDRI
ncbi:MAG: hypothetical protein ACHP7N_09705 [Caulobacterales bacterium]